MINETEVFARFHSAFEVELPPGAAPRLRAILLTRLEPQVGIAWGRPLGGPRMSLRVAAGLMAIVVAVAATATFLATHRPAEPYLPAGPSPTYRALGGSGFDYPLMVSPTTGWWRIGGNIYRTTDGGASWPLVTPRPQGQQSLQTGLPGPTTSFFLDATHGVVVSGSQKFSTYITADGGKTWSIGAPVTGFPRSLDFVDPSHGWLISGQDLLRTEDGGDHWAVIASNTTSLCSWNSVAFASASLGWMAVSCAGGEGDIVDAGPVLMVSHDGGASWSSVQLPMAAAGLTCPPCMADAPIVFDQQHALVVVRGNGGTAGVTWGPVHILVTSDGGTHWSGRTVPGQSPSVVDFVDFSHGWTIAGFETPSLYRTDDGGLTWTPVATNVLLFGTVYFVDLDHGFFSVGRLYKTADGGHTWVVVQCLRNQGPPNFCPN